MGDPKERVREVANFGMSRVYWGVNGDERRLSRVVQGMYLRHNGQVVEFPPPPNYSSCWGMEKWPEGVESCHLAAVSISYREGEYPGGSRSVLRLIESAGYRLAGLPHLAHVLIEPYQIGIFRDSEIRRMLAANPEYSYDLGSQFVPMVFQGYPEQADKEIGGQLVWLESLCRSDAYLVIRIK